MSYTFPAASVSGTPLPIDLGSLTQSSGKRIFTFLSQAFGLMADLGKEKKKLSLRALARVRTANCCFDRRPGHRTLALDG